MRLIPGLLILTLVIAILGFVSVKSSEVSATSSLENHESDDFASSCTKGLLPDTPIVFSPANKLVVSGQSVFFSWHTTCPDDNYELMYSWNSDFESAQSVMVKDSVYSLGFSEVVAQPLYWKIRTVTKEMEFSQWTTVHSVVFQPVVSAWQSNHN